MKNTVTSKFEVLVNGNCYNNWLHNRSDMGRDNTVKNVEETQKLDTAIAGQLSKALAVLSDIEE